MIPLIIFILSIISVTIGFIVGENVPFSSKWNAVAGPMVVIGLLAGLLSFLIFPQYEESYKLYPVEYTVAKSTTHIAVATNYGVFDSNKIQDLNEWSQGKPGFIKVKYNVFGLECQEYEFVTNNTKE